MGSEWLEVRLSDAVDLIGGGTPKRSIPEYWGGTIPWLSVKDFNYDYRHVDSTEESITERGLAKSSTKVLVEGQLIISARGTVGALAQLSKPMAFNQSCYGINAKAEYATNDFLYYLLKYSIVNLKQITHGAVFDTITRETFDHIIVNLPPLPKQRAIAHILGSLDDKIELNRRMNETLEAMARAIFKSWFVDFDPVRAKVEGRDPGLPNEIAALFPDSFQDSDLGEIPKRWEVNEIKECCKKVQNGGTPKRSEPDYWNPGTIPWLTSGEVRQTLITTTENMISELGLKKSSAKWLPEDSTVVALYGATAGQVALVSLKMTTNQAVCGLIPKASFRYFNYLSLDRSVGILANLARGSAQQNISKGIVETTKVIIPRTDILISFDQVVLPVFDKWVANLEESKTLASLRDALLPKLISGELHVPNTGTLLESVI